MSLEALLTSGGARSASGAYLRYRMRITGYNGSSAVIISELELLDENGVNFSANKGTPFASSSYNSGLGPEKAFDGLWPPYNATNNTWQTNTAPPQHLGIVLPTAKRLARYGIRYPDVGNSAGIYYPNTWIMEASNDGTSWFEVHRVSGYTTAMWGTKNYHTWNVAA